VTGVWVLTPEQAEMARHMDISEMTTDEFLKAIGVTK
jgi:hypothetical protein